MDKVGSNSWSEHNRGGAAKASKAVCHTMWQLHPCTGHPVMLQHNYSHFLIVAKTVYRFQQPQYGGFAERAVMGRRKQLVKQEKQVKLLVVVMIHQLLSWVSSLTRSPSAMDYVSQAYKVCMLYWGWNHSIHNVSILCLPNIMGDPDNYYYHTS